MACMGSSVWICQGFAGRDFKREDKELELSYHSGIQRWHFSRLGGAYPGRFHPPGHAAAWDVPLGGRGTRSAMCKNGLSRHSHSLTIPR